MGDLRYQSGFGSYFSTEALENTLPVGQNSPQKVNHGLYAEQLSGAAFTEPRTTNVYSWLFRIRPSVCQGKFKDYNHPKINRKVFEEGSYHPNAAIRLKYGFCKYKTTIRSGVTCSNNGKSFFSL